MRQAIEAAVKRLGVIPFFPADEDARLEVMHALEDMIGDETLYGSTPQQRLDWLVKAAVNAMRRWEGLPELRGILCSKWRASDRIEAYSSLPGYSAEDSESRAIGEYRTYKAVETGRMSPRLLEAAACDRMPEAELAQLHRDTIGRLIEATRFPNRRRESLAAAERELAEAPRNYLSEEQKALRLAALEAGLKTGDNS